jgi:rhodanese-related sulfurtransferase
MDKLGEFVTHHWQLWLALGVILILIIINEILQSKKKAQEVSPAKAVDLINNHDTAIIDLRDTESYRAGHIIHSLRATAEDFHQQKMDKYKAKPFILVCAQGLQSRTLAAKLQEQGFQEPLVLTGGIQAWAAANLPLVKK